MHVLEMYSTKQLTTSEVVVSGGTITLCWLQGVDLQGNILSEIECQSCMSLHLGGL